MHRDHVIGRDDRRDGVGPSRSITTLSYELKGRAATVMARDLDKCQILSASQEPDPVGGDGLVADGAAESVRERALWVAGIHPRGV